MKPLRLTITNFGPFAGSHVIDFSKICAHGFFLINGPTGSGKTTILDSICFALYGDTSGGDRDSDQIRSHHVADTEPVFVVLDFQLGPHLYRIKRSPRQRVVKKRSSGYKQVASQATLWQRDGRLAQEDDGVVLATRAKTVTARVQELLGFEHAQFTQVAMLPQGKFRDLLVAKSKDRQAILQALFGTHHYHNIEEALKSHAKSVKTEMLVQTKQFDHILQQAAVESVEQLLQQKHRLTAELELLLVQLEKNRQSENRAAEKLSSGQHHLLLLQERETAQQRLQTLTQQQPEMDRGRTKLQQARLALPLVEIDLGLQQRLKEYQQAVSRLQETTQGLQQAEREQQQAKQMLLEQASSKVEVSQLQAQLTRLEEMGNKISLLEQSQEQYDGSRRAHKKAQREQEKIQKALDKITLDLEQCRQRREKTQQTASHLDADAMILERAKQHLHKRQRLDSLHHEMTSQRRQEELATAEEQAIERRLEAQREQYRRLQQDWYRGQASVLAQELKPGVPCPVCGSGQHPQPASSEKAVPDQRDLEQKEKNTAELMQQREQCSEKLNAIRTHMAALTSQFDQIRKDLGDRQQLLLQVIAAQVEEKQQAVATAQQAQKELQQLQRQEEKLQTKQAQAKKQLSETTVQLQQCQSQLDQCQATLLAHGAELPPEFSSQKQVDREKQQTTARLAKIEHELASAQERAQKAEELLTKSQAELVAAKHSEDKARLAADRQTEKFTAALTDAGFCNSGDYRKAVLSRQEIDQLERELLEFGGLLKAAQVRCSRAEERARDLQPPDMAQLQTALEQAKQALEKAIEQQATQQAQQKQIDGWLVELTQSNQRLSQLEKSYAIAGQIAEVASGKNAYKIGFERFVLSSLLDEVLDVASQRLRKMSSGRYDMHRSRENSNRRGGGLDLEVSDSYTGTSRPVNTLSGGESFLAALSLALGLADVVQSHSGGIRLDTVFVDEGFSSLDPEALDLAMNALLDLQQGGRLVGIISHVPELKQRIDTRLELSKGRGGSSVGFHQ